jgi:hypothetical protein
MYSFLKEDRDGEHMLAVPTEFCGAEKKLPAIQ